MLSILPSVDNCIESFFDAPTLHPGRLGEETKLFDLVADIPNDIAQNVSFHQCSCRTWSKYFLYIQRYSFEGNLYQKSVHVSLEESFEKVDEPRA
mgnify:CR=1 FL=1